MNYNREALNNVIKTVENTDKEQLQLGSSVSFNSSEDWRAPTFNQWTRSYDDLCSEQNRLRIGSKPIKYYTNQYNSPQVAPFMEYTLVGNQQAYNVRNDYERSIPTRLNPIYPTQILPFPTTPNLGQEAPNRLYIDTSSDLRFGNNPKSLKSEVGLTEVDYNRWSPGVSEQTVQNAGQFGMKLQQPVNSDGYYDLTEQNNVILYNSSIPYFGISSRNLLDNVVELSNC